MKCAVVSAGLLLLSGSAFALQLPSGAKNGDPRVCDVVFNPNDIAEVTATVGNTVFIRFGSKERIAYVSASDTAHLKYFISEGSNALWLKATEPMPAQPVSVRTLQEDGTPRDYAMQWTALPTPTKVEPQVATSTAPAVSVTEAPPRSSDLCYVIRYQYPADEAAARAAEWKARQAKAKQEATEIALHNAQAGTARNFHYVAMGDLSIGPTEISDDGNTTELRFPGNVRIPTILTVTPDGKESQITGITTEDNGLVKLHGTMPLIRLRDGDLVLCLFNRAFNAAGTEPGTGTTNPTIRRDVHVNGK